LAKNIHLENNQTFVRGHIKGSKSHDIEIVYRSRSATQTYFEILREIEKPENSSDGIASIDWMIFEDLCLQFLESKGYEILDRTKSRQPKFGDDGCDILAKKIVRNRQKRFVVQARHRKTAMQPDAIREAEGTKKLWNADNAILISSSGFSDQAIDTATELDFILYDYEQMVSELKD
jgi:HJR/Mrr/RecB family endonuclease